MESWQRIVIVFFGILSFIGFIKAIFECRIQRNAYGRSRLYEILFSGFVWGDVVVFGLFWMIVSLFTLLISDWILFLLIFSLFWLIRSIGETQYWFHQQFTPRKGNEPEKFWSYKIVHSDAVWFVNQIYWQCVTVITIVTSLYLAKLWVSSV